MHFWVEAPAGDGKHAFAYNPRRTVASGVGFCRLPAQIRFLVSGLLLAGAQLAGAIR